MECSICLKVHSMISTSNQSPKFRVMSTVGLWFSSALCLWGKRRRLWVHLQYYVWRMRKVKPGTITALNITPQKISNQTITLVTLVGIFATRVTVTAKEICASTNLGCIISPRIGPFFTGRSTPYIGDKLIPPSEWVYKHPTIGLMTIP